MIELTIELTWLVFSVLALTIVLRATTVVGSYSKEVAARYLIAILIGSVLDDLIWALLALFAAVDLRMPLVSVLLLTFGRLARVLPVVAFAIHLTQWRPFRRREHL
jgi:Na+/phosphate symporter